MRTPGSTYTTQIHSVVLYYSLTFAPKSHSNTSSHLLFLPASPVRRGDGFGYVGYSSVSASPNDGYSEIIHINWPSFFTCLQTWPGRYGGNAVRLATVVSESAGILDRKNRGDRGSMPYGRLSALTTSIPLISSVVASNPFNLAISDAIIRPDFDKFHNCHSNGDVNQIEPCSFLHCRNRFGVFVRTTATLKEYLPSVKSLSENKKTGIRLEARCLLIKI